MSLSLVRLTTLFNMMHLLVYSSEARLAHSFILFVLSSCALASQFIEAEALPSNISNACVTALTTDTACRAGAAELVPGKYNPFSTLQNLCVSSCSSALTSYHASVLSSCAEDTWEDASGELLPVALYSELIKYAYDFTCLEDGYRFCNNVAAAYAAGADPQASDVPGGVPAGGDFGQHDTLDPCDSCLLANLRFQAGSPYYDGPVLQSRSVYQSKTSSCGVTGAPLTTTANSLLT